jgi:hypothetical protein
MVVSLLLSTRGIFFRFFVAANISDANKGFPSSSFSIQLRSDPYENDWDEVVSECDEASAEKNSDSHYPSTPSLSSSTRFFGVGREYSIFKAASPVRGGARNENNQGVSNNNNEIHKEDERDDGDDDLDFLIRMERYRERRKIPPGQSPTKPFSSTYFSRGGPLSPSSSFRKQWKQHHSRAQNRMPQYVQTVQDWWTTNVSPKLQSLPKIVCRVEPRTTLKLRKTFRPLKTIIRFGADYNTQLGVWQFKSSWEDALIGGRLTLAGKELQLTKSWQLSVGAVEDLVTRLRFRAAINLQTFQAYARVGFRTERLTPLNVVEGFTILKRVPLDGIGGNVKLEVKANFALPEPEIEYSTETQRSLIGMGDIEVSIDELNLLLDY